MSNLDELTRLHQAADAALSTAEAARGTPGYMTARLDYNAAVLALSRATVNLVVAAHGWSINRTEATWLALVAAWHTIDGDENESATTGTKVP